MQPREPFVGSKAVLEAQWQRNRRPHSTACFVFFLDVVERKTEILLPVFKVI